MKYLTLLILFSFLTTNMSAQIERVKDVQKKIAPNDNTKTKIPTHTSGTKTPKTPKKTNSAAQEQLSKAKAKKATHTSNSKSPKQPRQVEVPAIKKIDTKEKAIPNKTVETTITQNKPNSKKQYTSTDVEAAKAQLTSTIQRAEKTIDETTIIVEQLKTKWEKAKQIVDARVQEGQLDPQLLIMHRENIRAVEQDIYGLEKQLIAEKEHLKQLKRKR